jgi:tetratricopeptide (TPR) repeat protein
MLAGEDAEAIRVGEAAYAMADELGLEQLRAHTLNTLGMARFATGGDGAGELERSIEIATAINSPEGVRSLKFLGATHALLGDLERSAELFARTRVAADRFHDAYNIRWLQAERALELYWSGDWDEALAIADEFVAAAEVGAPHYMEASCRRARGQIRFARGELDAARTDSIQALESSRAARDPWFLNPSLAFRARMLVEEGKRDEASAVADELLGLWRRTARVSRVAFEVGDLAVTMAALGRGRDLLDAAADATPTHWLAAGCAYVAGDYLRAAERYAEIGSRPDEAQARLEAAKALPMAAAAAERDRAVEFFREVGAQGRVRELEALLTTAG